MTLADAVAAAWLDSERKAKWFRILWLASLGMVALGYALIAWHYRGALPFP